LALARNRLRAYRSPTRRLRPHPPKSSAVIVLSTGLIAPMANLDAISSSSVTGIRRSVESTSLGSADVIVSNPKFRT